MSAVSISVTPSSTARRTTRTPSARSVTIRIAPKPTRCTSSSPPTALRAGGDKLAAKRAALAAGVPVLPTGTPEEIGFPLLVKAAAGGGGRGMRVVRDAAGLDEAVHAARREATAAFGDDTVFFERHLERPRHGEIQL